MTAKELESEAWRVIGMAKVAVNKTRRKVLMQEAFDLLTRASALRKLESDNEKTSGASPSENKLIGCASPTATALRSGSIYELRAGPMRFGPPML